jgi:hypothetical protein
MRFVIGFVGSKIDGQTSGELSKRGALQPMGIVAQWLRHLIRLAVRPTHAPLFEIDPVSFEHQHLGYAGRKLKLEPDRERDRRMLQSFPVGTIDMDEELPQFFGDEPRRSCLAVLLNVFAWIGAVRAVPP